MQVPSLDKGFRHTEASIEIMRKGRLDRKHTEAAKLNLSTASATAMSVLVVNDKTSETKGYTSVRKAAKFMGMHHSYIAKCLKTHKVYKGKGYTIVQQVLLALGG